MSHVIVASNNPWLLLDRDWIMSYPDPQYTGEGGEASATVRLASAPPELDGRTSMTSYLSTGASTGGKYGLYRWDFKGPRSGPDPHFHRSITEAFFVLSGEVQLYDGRRWVTGRPGDYLYVPEGGLHGFRNESGEKASMLILFARARHARTTSSGSPPPARCPRRNAPSSICATTPSGSDGAHRQRPSLVVCRLTRDHEPAPWSTVPAPAGAARAIVPR
jgi:quercetin dioxygenase-like cupin family protein